MRQKNQVSVILPVLNETPDTLKNLQSLINLPGIFEIIIVDASDDQNTVSTLEEFAESSHLVHLVRSEESGRALQMNIGARRAKGNLLWFLHADTTVPESSIKLITDSLSKDHRWGRFDVQFVSSKSIMKIIAFFMNIRSALSGICTGDQAIFVEFDTFQRVQGFPAIAIMEDIAISKQLKKISPPARLKIPVSTSARRWESEGYTRTITKMWLMRILYWAGVSPTKLARIYKQVL